MIPEQNHEEINTMLDEIGGWKQEDMLENDDIGQVETIKQENMIKLLFKRNNKSPLKQRDTNNKLIASSRKHGGMRNRRLANMSYQ